MGTGTVVLSCTYTGNYFKDLAPGRVNQAPSRQSGTASKAFVFVSDSTTHRDPPGAGHHPMPAPSETASSCFELHATLTPSNTDRSSSIWHSLSNTPQAAARTQVGFHAGLQHRLEIGWSCRGEAAAKHFTPAVGIFPAGLSGLCFRLLGMKKGDGWQAPAWETAKEPLVILTTLFAELVYLGFSIVPAVWPCSCCNPGSAGMGKKSKSSFYFPKVQISTIQIFPVAHDP